jgi:hypothetical protein
MRKLADIFLKLVLLAAFMMPTIALAQTSPTVTCEKGKYCALTTIPGLTEAQKPTDPVKVIKNIYGVSIGIAAILAVGMIIWAGIQYATVESISGHSDAKKTWEGALWGLALLLGSYLILQTINVDLVRINLDLGKPATCMTKNVAGKNVPCLVASDPINQLLSSVEKSVTDAKKAQESTVSIQEQAKNAVKSIDEQIASLNTELQNPNLSAADKSRITNEIQYATAIRDFRKSDELTAERTVAINKSIQQGTAVDLNSLRASINSEIERLEKSDASSSDAKLRLAIEERVKNLKQKALETNTIYTAVTNENQIYSRATNIYIDAKPTKAGITTDQFLRELASKEILVNNKMSTPISAINSIESSTNIVQTETKSILQTYGATYSKNLNSIIENRVKCYDIFLKQGYSASAAAGCKSF